MRKIKQRKMKQRKTQKCKMHTAEQGSVDLVQRDRIAENKNWSPLSYIKLN